MDGEFLYSQPFERNFYVRPEIWTDFFWQLAIFLILFIKDQKKIFWVVRLKTHHTKLRSRRIICPNLWSYKNTSLKFRSYKNMRPKGRLYKYSPSNIFRWEKLSPNNDLSKRPLSTHSDHSLEYFWNLCHFWLNEWCAELFGIFLKNLIFKAIRYLLKCKIWEPFNEVCYFSD